MNDKERLDFLEERLKLLYEKQQDELLFHGWHHIIFVRNKGSEFAQEIGADDFLVQSASLLHDLNYIVEPNSEPEVGKELRKEILVEVNYQKEEIERIEQIIMEACTATRDIGISMEGKALSDADTLFKTLPITPILFTGKYLQETKVDISKLAKKICEEQNKLMDNGIYFYTEKAKTAYLGWAKVNLQLWNNVESCLADEDVQKMLNIAKSSGVI